eukprot:GDKJ01064387.1.p1 GENE.GDKJ01064387.1~~GDKJ01064387.1.p1  ORF type:complete len:727 (+),score=169.03 GDKJ01064387.1:26-2206(+)
MFAIPKRKYLKVKDLGAGAFGKCILVEDESKEQFCMKVVDMSKLNSKQQKEALCEGKLHSKLTHPFIVELDEFFMEGGCLKLVMEYASGGDLAHAIKKMILHDNHFPEVVIRTWLCQALLGLQYLHETKMVLHRDIKTANLFLGGPHGDRLLIGDFGISKQLESRTPLKHTQLGTPYFLAPEVCKGVAFSIPADVWSLGCVFFELMTLKPAYSGHTVKEVYESILSDPLPDFPFPYSESLKSLVRKMLTVDWRFRPTVTELIAHDYMQDTCHLVTSTLEKERAEVEENKKRMLADSKVRFSSSSPVKHLPEVHLHPPFHPASHTHASPSSQTAANILQSAIQQTEKFENHILHPSTTTRNSSFTNHAMNINNNLPTHAINHVSSLPSTPLRFPNTISVCDSKPSALISNAAVSILNSSQQNNSAQTPLPSIQKHQTPIRSLSHSFTVNTLSIPPVDIASIQSNNNNNNINGNSQSFLEPPPLFASKNSPLPFSHNATASPRPASPFQRPLLSSRAESVSSQRATPAVLNAFSLTPRNSLSTPRSQSRARLPVPTTSASPSCLAPVSQRTEGTPSNRQQNSNNMFSYTGVLNESSSSSSSSSSKHSPPSLPLASPPIPSFSLASSTSANARQRPSPSSPRGMSTVLPVPFNSATDANCDPLRTPRVASPRSQIASPKVYTMGSALGGTKSGSSSLVNQMDSNSGLDKLMSRLVGGKNSSSSLASRKL